MDSKRSYETKTKINEEETLKKENNIYAKFIKAFGFKTKSKSKYLYSKDGKIFLTTHQEALKILEKKQVTFIGRGETVKIKINDTNYLFFLRGSKAVETNIVKKVEKILGRKYFWIVSKSLKRVVAASNGEYAIIVPTKQIRILF